MGKKVCEVEGRGASGRSAKLGRSTPDHGEGLGRGRFAQSGRRASGIPDSGEMAMVGVEGDLGVDSRLFRMARPGESVRGVSLGGAGVGGKQGRKRIAG